MRNRNVVYIGSFELPDKDAAAHRVLGIAKALRECGNRVYFVGADRSGKVSSDSRNILETRKEVQGFECYFRVYPQNSKDWIEYLFDIRSYTEVLDHIGNIDAVICYDLSAISLEKIRRFCKRRNILCIADNTEWYSVAGRRFPVNVIKGLDEFFRMRIIHKRLDGLIVISSYLKRYYKKCENVIRIPPLTDLNEEKWINRYEKDKRVLRLVYAGAPGRKDRIDYLIKAVGGLNRSYRLDVIGITKDEYLKLYSGHEDIVNRNDNIKFHGRISHREVLEYVKKANYSCFFRDRSRVAMAGFPTKFVEAISSGTPVISNDTSDLLKYTEKGNGIILDSADLKSIRKVLETVPVLQKVNRGMFDYHNYIGKINKWMNIS